MLLISEIQHEISQIQGANREISDYRKQQETLAYKNSLLKKEIELAKAELSRKKDRIYF